MPRAESCAILAFLAGSLAALTFFAALSGLLPRGPALGVALGGAIFVAAPAALGLASLAFLRGFSGARGERVILGAAAVVGALAAASVAGYGLLAGLAG